MEKQLQSAEIMVGGKAFPIKLSEQEMNNLPQVEKNINERITDFQMKYKNLEKIDCISMALISYAFDLLNEKKSKSKEAVIEKIGAIQHLLEKA
jgi:cell division protein ZapA